MTAPPSLFSPLLRWVTRCARWALGALLALWLVLALLWVLLYGWVIPRIDQWRPYLQSSAERALGVPVRLGALHAHSQGLMLSFTLTEVTVLDAQGQPALHLPRVVLVVSPRSLLRAGLEQLLMEGPQLNLHRHADGQITLGGIALGRDSGAAQTSAPQHSRAADWLFSQTEVVLREGTLLWRDDLRQMPPLALSDVTLVLRNRAWHHALRLDATPPPEWGQRFTLQGQFREPILSLHEGDWQRWSGQVYALFSRVDLAQLHRYLPFTPTLELRQGQATLRAWVDVQRGQARGAVFDVQGRNVHATLAPGLAPLALRSVSGRLRASRWATGWELATHALQWHTAQGLHWPASNASLRYQENTSRRTRSDATASMELHSDVLDLAVLTHLARALPLGTSLHTALHTYRPAGQIHDLHAQWNPARTDKSDQSDQSDPPWRYQVKGHASGLALAAATASPRTLGVQGLGGDFSFTQDGGQAQIEIKQGALILPGIFEEPIVPLQHLQAKVDWQSEGEHLAVQIPQVRFANADAQGQAQLRWHTSDPQRSGSKGRLPGVLDLSGELHRAQGTRVHRYLPLVIDAEVRHYVRDAVRSGHSDQVQFKVQGDLYDMPFNRPEQGQFRIAAKVKEATYAYVPPTLQSPGERPWPVLTQLAGELIFERSSMYVRNASTGVAGFPQWRMAQVQAHIPDLAQSVVHVNAQGRGPLAEMLAVVDGSPLADFTAHALAQSQGSGSAEMQLNLTLPISHLEQSRVRGSVGFLGNSVQITPDTPALSQVRGAVQFSDQGFSVNGVRAQALGGEVLLEGGMAHRHSPIELRAQGQASAEGLRQTPQLGLLAQWAQHAQGSAPYQFAMKVQPDSTHPELRVHTTLQGMALDLPAPLGKGAESRLPVAFETQLLNSSSSSSSSLLSLSIEGVGAARYVRDLSGPLPRVLRGAIDLGWSASPVLPDALALPAVGVAAQIHWPQIDIDAWQALLTPPAAPPANIDTNIHGLYDYLPNQIALRTERLQAQGRQLHGVIVAGSREGLLWRANIQARELEGYVQYRQPAADESAGQLFARLAYLHSPPSNTAQIDSLLSEQQPRQLPALDIEVQDFELHGRNLGRLQIRADNRGAGSTGREWRLSAFDLTTPHARFTSHGRWTLQGGQRRSQIEFQLDMDDAGELLGRLDMAGVLRHGKGQLAGQVAWTGSPIQPDYRSMSGQMHLDIETGQFLKADPGLAKLLGVLSLQSLPRRLALDFRDVFSAGFAFDFVRGDVQIERGIASTNNLQMKGVNAAVLMEGQADIERETQNLHVVIVPEIDAMTASLVATAINPVVGLGSFLAQAVLRGPLASAATQELRIEGTWADPQVIKLPAGTSASAPSAKDAKDAKDAQDSKGVSP